MTGIGGRLTVMFYFEQIVIRNEELYTGLVALPDAFISDNNQS